MKFILSLFLLCAVQFTYAQENDTRYFYPDYTFEKGRIELMYGNNVVLRADQHPDSKALDTLKIGDPVTIIEKGNTTTHLNGQPSYWYKVKSKKKVGYVLGGWISLDHTEINGKTYMSIFAERDDLLYLRTRVLSKDKSYYGHETPLNTYMVSFDVKDNQGLKEIDGMYIISMHAEACGVEGGKAYLFDDGMRLTETIRTTRVSDAGAFWFVENIQFKDSEYWEDNTVYFSQELGEYMDDSIDWTRSVTNRVMLTWDGEKFTPDVSKLNFQLEEEE